MNHWLADDGRDPMLLFHYTRAETLDKILDGGRLRLSTYASTNDPRETKEWVAEVVLAAELERPDLLVEAQEARRMADRILRRGARLACFTLDRAPAPGAEIGSLFHRGWARSRMWSQYAEEHSGACLVFRRDVMVEQVDRHRPLADGDLFSCGAVTYLDTPLRIPLVMAEVAARGVLEALDDLQVRRGVAGELYFTKNTDWASEEEFRIVVVRWNLPLPELDNPLDIPFGGALRAVVVGDGYLEANLPGLLHRMAGYPEVEIVRCSWEGGAPVLAPVGQTPR
jgi:hypothetical protein